MKKLFFLISFIAVFLGTECVSAQTIIRGNMDIVKGNGNIISKTFDISEYKAIETVGSASFVYEQKSGAPYLRIETDENILPLMKVKVDNDVLTVRSNQSYSPTKLIVYTNSRALSWAKISGSGNIELKGNINLQDLKLTVAGSGNIYADKLSCNSVSAKVAGSGNIKLGGKVETLDGNVAGSGGLNTTALLASNATGRVAGSGNLSIYASKTLDLRVSGSGSIKYKGPATVNKSVSGSGRIKNDN